MLSLGFNDMKIVTSPRYVLRKSKTKKKVQRAFLPCTHPHELVTVTFPMAQLQAGDDTKMNTAHEEPPQPLPLIPAATAGAEVGMRQSTHLVP